MHCGLRAARGGRTPTATPIAAPHGERQSGGGVVAFGTVMVAAGLLRRTYCRLSVQHVHAVLRGLHVLFHQCSALLGRLRGLPLLRHLHHPTDVLVVLRCADGRHLFSWVMTGVPSFGCGEHRAPETVRVAAVTRVRVGRTGSPCGFAKSHLNCGATRLGTVVRPRRAECVLQDCP